MKSAYVNTGPIDDSSLAVVEHFLSTDGVKGRPHNDLDRRVAPEEMKEVQMDVQRVPSNRQPWDSVGYSRAVRVGQLVEVSGTTAVTPEGKVIAPGNMYEQAKECLRIIEDALEDLGASVEHVVRTRVFLKDISRWEEAGRAHKEVFGDVLPASSFVEVSGFLKPEFLIEVEATAIVA